VDIPRNPPDPERDAAIKARKDMAGRFGFALGCVAAVIAVSLELYFTAWPLTFLSFATAVLMAALNMPIGIALGLAGERLTRPKELRR